MVGRDVEQNPHVGPERARSVQLETTHFNDRGFGGAFVSVDPLGEASRPACADVAHAVRVPPFVTKYVVDHGRGGGFAIGTRHGHHGGGVSEGLVHARGVFDFADHFAALVATGLHHGGIVRDARALDYHGGVVPVVGLVPADFVGDAGRLEFRHAWSLPFPRVAHERARAQGLRQKGGAHAAFAGAKYEDGISEVHGVR